MDGQASYAQAPDEERDESPERMSEAIERLINIEAKLDGFVARQDARFAEVRERLAHAEERLDYLLERLAQPPARPVGFLHVPKSAGTSFTGALIEAVRPRCAVGGFDQSLFGGFSDFASFVPERRRNIFAGPHQIPPFCDLLAGHFALSTIRGWAPEAAVVMILREPRARLLSHWTFWRTELAEYRATLGGWHAFVAQAEKPFGAFLRAPEVACQTDNLAARMLLWPHELIPADDFIAPEHDEALLTAAKRILAGLACVNVTENPALGEDMAAWLRRPFAMPALKITAPAPAGLRTDLDAELTAETWKLWERRTRLDRELWALAWRRVIAGADAAAAGDAALADTLARHRALLAGG